MKATKVSEPREDLYAGVFVCDGKPKHDPVSVCSLARAILNRRIDELVAEELRAIRDCYDRMEELGARDNMEPGEPQFVTWRGWKMVRNVIKNRIEGLTGSRK